MNKVALFAGHLAEIGLFARDAQLSYVQMVGDRNLGKEMGDEDTGGVIKANDLETRIIFSLADFLKSQDAERYFDIAERMFKTWEKRGETQKHKVGPLISSLSHVLNRRLSSAVNRIIIRSNGMALSRKGASPDVQRCEEELPEGSERRHEIRKSACKTPSKVLSLKDCASLNDVRFESRQISAPIQEPSSAHSFSSSGGHEKDSPAEPDTNKETTTVFNKLYSAAGEHKQFQRRNEEIHKERETQYCTFKPQVKTGRSSCSKENDRDLYGRLASINKSEKVRYLESQKRRLELQHCTFKPNSTLSRPKSQSSVRRELLPVYEKLYREREVRENVKKSKQAALKNKELDGCTFYPSTHTKPYVTASRGTIGSLSSRDLVIDPCERLYQDHERKAREITRNEIVSGAQIDKECTFKPNLVSAQLNKTGGDVPVHEKLYREHMRQQEALDMKRHELEEESKRMHRSRKSLYYAYSSARSPSAKKENEEADIFERLHRLHKEEATKKAELGRKVLQEQGATFSPRVDSKSMQMVQGDKHDMLERNALFIEKKNKWLEAAQSRVPPTCTFKPKNFSQRRPVSPAKPEEKLGENDDKSVVERLYAYLDYYEQRRAEAKGKLKDHQQ